MVIISVLYPNRAGYGVTFISCYKNYKCSPSELAVMPEGLEDNANSYLPFFGLDSIRQAAARLVGLQSGQE